MLAAMRLMSKCRGKQVARTLLIASSLLGEQVYPTAVYCEPIKELVSMRGILRTALCAGTTYCFLQYGVTVATACAHASCRCVG